MACPAVSVCCVAGAASLASAEQTDIAIAATHDGGRHWLTRSIDVSGVPGGPVIEANLYDIACWSATSCMAVGDAYTNQDHGSVWTTADGGNTWISRGLPASASELYAVTCVAPERCEVGGGSLKPLGTPLVLGTTNGGATWQVQKIAPA